MYSIHIMHLTVHNKTDNSTNFKVQLMIHSHILISDLEFISFNQTINLMISNYEFNDL